MSLQGAIKKHSYRKNRDNVVMDFYVPALSTAKKYDRAVGFFSSTALVQIAAGLDKLIESGGEMRVVISPELDANDIEAMKKGYALRDIVHKKVENTPIVASSTFEKVRLDYLARLISSGQLKFKIAVVTEGGEFAIYHEKIGVIEDYEGNAVSFTGSVNESVTALKLNFESIVVFWSWASNFEKEMVEEHRRDFEDLWNNSTKGLQVFDFPEAAEKNILRCKQEKMIGEIDLQKLLNTPNARENEPMIPESITLRDFQQSAIDAWESNNNNGIFAMATGTGKTITGLGAAVETFKQRGSLFLLILCPYQFLVEQWKDDVTDFGFEPILCYSQSEDKNWHLRLKDQIDRFNRGRIKAACFIMTIATFQTENVQKTIGRCKGNFMLLADEAHHLGSGAVRDLLPGNFPFRLALSATIERRGDEEGTKAIMDYFDKVVFEYPLDLAIKNGVLVKYYYYPIPVYLSQDRLEECRRLTKEIARNFSKKHDGEENKYLELLMLRRARLLAGEPNKLLELRRTLDAFNIRGTKFNLFYCGATRTASMAEDSDNQEEIRQIEAVAMVVAGEPYVMRISKFTAEENRDQRSHVREDFENGDIDAIVAIRCLDEGFNIPKIERTFLLASSTNPKEYIQRRGRVLRKASGKDFAYIYDFVVLPRKISAGSSITEDDLKLDRNLVIRELRRVKDFTTLSENQDYGFNFINKTRDVFKIGFDSEGEEGGDSYDFTR